MKKERIKTDKKSKVEGKKEGEREKKGKGRHNVRKGIT